MASDITTEDEIDNMSMREALKRLKKRGNVGVNVADLKTGDSVRFLLKCELLCSEGSATNAASFVKRKTHDDTKLKENLFMLFDEVIEFAKQLNQTHGVKLVTSELNDKFPEICEKLKSSRQSIEESTPHVLILGESGSGKSSFINLFLGDTCTYFPVSVLSNTHVICEIRYAEQPRAELFTETDEIITLDTSNGKEKFIKELKENIEKTEYKLAKVYLPCEVLKGLVIVDSPGIGESEAMKNMTLDYIVNAAVFMYVIDSTNAGGMLSRVQELVQEVNMKLLQDQKSYRPDSALFICNKWDAITQEDKEKVVEDTRKNIKKCWQDCEDKQIICFSTKEAEYIQKQHGKLSPRFELILKSMSELIDLGREIVVLKGYSYVCQYMDRCVYHFKTVLSRLDITVSNRKMRYNTTQKRLEQLQTKIKTFFNDQNNNIEIEQGVIAKELDGYVNKEENKDKICRFTNRELPESTKWDQAAIEVRIKVHRSIQSLIKDWDAGKQLYVSLAKEMQEALERECPRFERDKYQAENDMAGVNRDEFDAGDEIDFLPTTFSRKISGMSTGLKVALGVGLSPVILVGLIVRIPIWGIKTIHSRVTHHSLEKEFKATKGDREKLKQVCQKYAKNMVGDITEKYNLNAVIEENLQPLRKYLQQQKLKMLDQIEKDRKFLKRLNEDKTNDEDVRKCFEPLKDQSLGIQKNLKDFKLGLFQS